MMPLVTNSAPLSHPLSGKVLLFCNLAVAVYALWQGWSLLDLVLLYWLETLVVIAFSFFKELYADVYTGPRWLLAVSAITFFIYVCFSIAHLQFLQSLFGSGKIPEELSMNLDALIGGIEYVLALGWIAPLLLIFQHGFSFIKNYLLGKEYQRTIPGQYMFYPVWRIYTLQLLIIIGGGIWMLLTSIGLSSDIAAILFFAVIKTSSDLKLHDAAHRALLST